MKRFLTLILLVFACSTFAAAQKINGKVYILNALKEKEPGAFSNVWWMEQKSVVEADED